ncbi:MAG: hypothetical protein JNL58_21135 [Planctomyces sp.]|nr:hypothetical protein [Planctomyces sp.]
MALRQPSKLEWAVIGVMLAILVALLIPSTQGVWDGDFSLTISVTESEPIDQESLLFATFWSEDQARDALAKPGVYEWGFHPSQLTDDGRATIDVPVFGRITTWGDTYNQPPFLVAEYRLAHDGKVTRKCFDIPTGRGPRSIEILLP